MNTSISQFDDMIAANSVLTHFFYEQKWNNGELSLEDLQVYAKEYFHLVKAVPDVVECVRKRTMDRQPELMEFIEENMQEEVEHIELWKRFAKSLGVTEAELEAYHPSAKVQEAVAELKETAEGSFEDAVATMYAMELDIPNVAQSKKDGLCKFYGLNESNEDAHIYFDEHLGEEKHFSVWRKVQIDPAHAEVAMKKSLAAQHKVLDAVCDECGITCPCM